MLSGEGYRSQNDSPQVDDGEKNDNSNDSTVPVLESSSNEVVSKLTDLDVSFSRTQYILTC